MIPIIEVRNLSKRYRLGAIGMTSLREELNRWWERLKSDGRRKTEDGSGTADGRRATEDRSPCPPSSVPGQPLTRPPSPASGPLSSVSGQPSPNGYLWALQDVSFDVQPGEVVGIPSVSLRAGSGRNDEVTRGFDGWSHTSLE